MILPKLNEKFSEIALQVGGSHYPEVGGYLLQQFGEQVVKECAKLCTNQYDAKALLNFFEIEQ